MRSRISMSLVAALCLLALSACGDAPSKAACEKLLDHVLDLEIQTAGASTPEMKADLDKQKKAVADSIGKEFMETCLDKLPASQVECGLGAKTMDELSRCDKN